MSRFVKILQEFVASNADFRVIYSTAAPVIGGPGRVCVLDSSFNPPHLGHYAMAKESLSYHFRNLDPGEKRTLLLLLSVRNADKKPAPAAFHHRVEMMYLMAQYLKQQLNVDVSVGLTNHAKFVDKSLAIINYLKQKQLTADDVKLTFLVGFDTLVRIFDPKYYLPDKLLDSLNAFMKATDLFCLTRTYGLSIEEQHEYVAGIVKGHHVHIPSTWHDSVHLHLGDDAVGEISSSAIRNLPQDWRRFVIPDVGDYIVEENLY